MKFLVYSTGGGLILGAFVMLMMQVPGTDVEIVSPPQKILSKANFVKIPLVTYPAGINHAPK